MESIRLFWRNTLLWTGLAKRHTWSVQRRLESTDPASEDKLMEPFAVNIPEASRLLSSSRSKIYELVAQKKLRIIKLGGKSLIAVDDIRAFIDSLKAAA
jgi:excisionase family DNA binding protein